MSQLDPRVRTLWQVLGVVAALAFTAVVALSEALLLVPARVTPVPPGTIGAGVLAVSLVLGLGWPLLRYRHWSWQVEPDRVSIQRGVVWRARTLIPRVRVQHVDTRTSPLQRAFGLSSLIIYTAGTRGADVEIPGLAAEEAERLREELGHLEERDERT